jgi:hypothetical protein
MEPKDDYLMLMRIYRYRSQQHSLRSAINLKVHACTRQKMMNMMLLYHILCGVILHSAFIVEGANIGPDGVCALSTFVPFTSGG